MGLNHMNGRVQDAITGRFLSPDPYVQAPGFTQSFNRYSYTFNNPLSYTDPSGFQAAPPEVEPPRGPGLDVIGGPYSGIADFHARAAWARLYGIRNAMARWMRNTHPEFFSTPTQFANSRIAGGAGGGNPGRGHAGGGNTGGPGSEPPHEDFREHQVGSGLVGGQHSGWEWNVG